DMEPYEESAIQETEPAEDTYQAMLHGIFTSACGVGAMSAEILVPGLVGQRSVETPRTVREKMLRSTYRACPERMSCPLLWERNRVRDGSMAQAVECIVMVSANDWRLMRCAVEMLKCYHIQYEG